MSKSRQQTPDQAAPQESSWWNPMSWFSQPQGNAAAQEDSRGDFGTLAPFLRMGARGEFNGAPLNPNNAYSAYSRFGAADFIDPNDMRLQQLNRVVSGENTSLQQAVRETLAAKGVEGANVYGRAKTPASILGKLHETPGMTIGDIHDMSGARVDLSVNQPGFAQHKAVKEALTTEMGGTFLPKKDYIQNPNSWGYTGRIHGELPGTTVPGHEIQIGSGDLSSFIDKKVTNASGQSRSIHDMTNYKGDLYGYKLSDEMGGQYTDLIRKIGENDGTGVPLAKNTGLAEEVSGFTKAVEEGLPNQFPEMPVAELTKWQKAKDIAGKGMGVLGVAGGGLQMYDGANKILNGGDKVEGGFDLLEGGVNVGGGIATIAGSTLAAPLGAAAATIDGVGDIYQGIRDGDVEKGVLGGVKTAAGGMMTAGLMTANPLLIGAGALTYGGSLVYENWDAISSGASWLGNKAMDGVGWAGNKIGEGASWLGNKAMDGLSTAGNAISDGASWVGNKAMDGLSAAGGAISDGASWVGNKASDAASWVGDTASSAWDAVTSW